MTKKQKQSKRSKRTSRSKGVNPLYPDGTAKSAKRVAVESLLHGMSAPAPEPPAYNPFDDSSNYAEMLQQGKIFRDNLKEGDSRYEKSWVNRVALKERIVGYIAAQPWFDVHQEYLSKAFPKDDIYLFAADMADQIVNDLVFVVVPEFAEA